MGDCYSTDRMKNSSLALVPKKKKKKGEKGREEKKKKKKKTPPFTRAKGKDRAGQP